MCKIVPTHILVQVSSLHGDGGLAIALHTRTRTHVSRSLYSEPLLISSETTTRCLKNIPDIFDCNLKIDYRILIIFGTNIPDTTCHQMTI